MTQDNGFDLDIVCVCVWFGGSFVSAIVLWGIYRKGRVGNVHRCTGTEALYRPNGPWVE